MFERLTRRDKKGVAYVPAGKPPSYVEFTGISADRLAAYEDSELSPEEVHELAKAKAEGRLVVLPCKGEELREKYRALTSPTGDGVQTYTTGYRNGHRNGQAELIAYLLQIDLGTREAAEKALGGAEG